MKLRARPVSPVRMSARTFVKLVIAVYMVFSVSKCVFYELRRPPCYAGLKFVALMA